MMQLVMSERWRCRNCGKTVYAPFARMIEKTMLGCECESKLHVWEHVA